MSFGSGVKGMNDVKVFIGYQFKSPHFCRSEMENCLVEACDRAQDDTNRERRDHVNIRPDFLDLLSGEWISSQILAKLAQADICVLEISDLNPNVFLELGYALGRGKPCIYLQHEDQDISRIPSDIQGMVVVRYTKETLTAKLAYEIYRRTQEIIRERAVQQAKSTAENEDQDILRAFWGLEGEHSIYLVCPEIPQESRIVDTSLVMRHYVRLMKFADLDTLFYLEGFMSRYFPDIRVYECTCNNVPPEAYEENFISIGGIAWNKVTAELIQRISLPFVQRDGGAGKDDPIEDIRTKTQYLPTVGTDGAMQEDIGFFVKVPNPANKKRSLFIINGIRTHGVLGAAKCFAGDAQSVDNCSYILKPMGKDPQFVALLRVPVINNFVAVLNISKPSIMMELLGYSPERNEFV